MASIRVTYIPVSKLKPQHVTQDSKSVLCSTGTHGTAIPPPPPLETFPAPASGPPSDCNAPRRLRISAPDVRQQAHVPATASHSHSPKRAVITPQTRDLPPRVAPFGQVPSATSPSAPRRGRGPLTHSVPSPSFMSLDDAPTDNSQQGPAPAPLLRPTGQVPHTARRCVQTQMNTATLQRSLHPLPPTHREAQPLF